MPSLAPRLPSLPPTPDSLPPSNNTNDNKRRSVEEGEWEPSSPSKRLCPETKLDEERQFQLHLHKAQELFQNFLDAYEGKYTDALGADNPRRVRAYRSLLSLSKCVVLVSTKSKSILFPEDAPRDHIRYRYDTYSQNPMLDVKVGQQSPKADGRKLPRRAFSPCCNLHINAEQMTGRVARKTLENADAPKLKTAILNLGLPPITTLDSEVSSLVGSLKNRHANDSIDFIRLKLNGSSLWIRQEEGLSGDQDDFVKTFLDIFSSDEGIEYVTIIRTSIEEDRRFIDVFWDYLIHRCMDDGIYWGYKLHGQVTDYGTNRGSYSDQVLLGQQPTPYLSWMAPKDGERTSHTCKSWFTSYMEAESIFTIAILQYADFERRVTNSLFSFAKSSPCHRATLRRSSRFEEPAYFTLHIKVGKTSNLPLPPLSADTKFNIRVFGTSESPCLKDEIEATLLEILPENHSGRADFVLGISVPDYEFPWGFDPRDGKSFDVKLQMKFDVTKHQKRLSEMKKEINNAEKSGNDIWCDSRWSADEIITLYREALEKLRTSDVRGYNTHVMWKNSIEIAVENAMMAFKLRPFVPAADSMDVDSQIEMTSSSGVCQISV